jgi:hypothetical protein
MKIKYIYSLITVAALFCFVETHGQTKPDKKPAAKPKAAAKKPVAVTDKKATSLAKSLPVNIDTTKTGGKTPNTQPNNGSSLNEEIIVTTAYKPVLAEAVKIRRNPDLEDKEPFKAPLSYSLLDKTLQLNTDIRQFDAMKMPRETPEETNNNYAKLGLGNLKTS